MVRVPHPQGPQERYAMRPSPAPTLPQEKRSVLG